jgi:DNA modification methylase
MINFIVESLQAHRVPIDTIKPDARNPRTHPLENLADIKASLTAFGQDQLLVVRKETGEIIKGNGRWAAMKELGWTEAAAIFVDDDEIKAMARNIADNRSSDTSEWSEDLLSAELQKLLGTEWKEATGFSDEEIQNLLEEYEQRSGADEKAREPVDETRSDELKAKWGTEVGQLWRLGEHYLMIGDSTDPQVVANLMQGERFGMAFTDPPYGISYDTTAVGRSQRRWKDIKNDALTAGNLEDFCRAFLGNLYRYGEPNWAGYICFASSTLHILREAIVSLNIRMHNIPIVWVKQNFALNWDLYKPQHEMIYFCGPGSTSKGEMARWYGERNESTVWNVSKDANKNYVHPTQKPVELSERAIRNSSQAGEIVVDLFGGSGSTLVATHQNKRRGRVVELDAGYAAVILERMAPLVADIAKVDVTDYPVPEGPERWESFSFRLAQDQAKSVTKAIRMLARQLGGKNSEARALEMLAVEWLNGNPEAVIDQDILVAEEAYDEAEAVMDGAST